MYNWEKSLREERSRKKNRNPSFSSSLLDEICRSIDDVGDKKSEEVKFHKERAAKKQSNGEYTNFKSKNTTTTTTTTTIEDEEMIRLRRARLIEKWIDKKVNEKAISNQKPQSLHELYKTSQLDNDPLFFSSSSCSSDSSFGGFSSSETEAPRPKPIRTNVSASSEKSTKVSEFYDHSEFLMFDDYNHPHHHHQRQNHHDTKNEEVIIKSKSRALKIYSNLKKVKQPISPGGRITSFINSLFTHGNAKKTKNSSSVSSYDDSSFERKSKSNQASTCSSASSYYRSCLSKTSANSREKVDNSVKRTVRFYPVTVIVDEHSRPCGQKCTYQQDCKKKSESKVDEVARYFENQNRIENEFMDNDEDDDDATSDTSSDLFELDHLTFAGANKYCEELPVYETTHFNRNLAIANGLFR